MITEFIRFIGVGGFNTVFSYIFYIALLQIFSYHISYSISYIFGIVLSYWLNLKFVFQEKSSKGKIMLYPLVYLVQYLFGITVLSYAVDKFNIPKEVAPLLVIILTVPVTFVLSKKIFSGKYI